MPFIIQLTNAVVVFVAVFYLPQFDKELASDYFVSLSLAQFMIMIVSPLSSKLLKDRRLKYDITQIIAQMFFNFSLSVLTISMLFGWNIVAVSLALFLVVVMQARSLSVADRKNYLSYAFSLLRGASPSIIILLIGLLSLPMHYLINVLCGTIIFIIFFYKQMYRRIFENLNLSILNGFVNSLYLSIPAGLIWLSFQLPRLLIEESAHLISFVQATAIPIAVFAIFESRGPYLFVDMAERKKHPRREYIVIILVYLLSSTASCLLIGFIEDVTSTRIDHSLLILYHFISCLISLFLQINRSLYLKLNEVQLFKALVGIIPVVGLGTYIYYELSDVTRQSIIVITYLTMLAIAMYALKTEKERI